MLIASVVQPKPLTQAVRRLQLVATLELPAASLPAFFSTVVSGELGRAKERAAPLRPLQLFPNLSSSKGLARLKAWAFRHRR